MDVAIFQKIIDELLVYISDDWEKIILYSNYNSMSYSMKFYVKIGNEYKDCFQMFEKLEIIQLFSRIDKIIKPEYCKLNVKDRWTLMTFVVDCNGAMKVDYEYDDFSDDTYGHYIKWKEKYLK